MSASLSQHLAPDEERSPAAESGSSSILPLSPAVELAEVLRALAFVAFALVVLWRGWLCDDAFISMRSVHHFVAGDGLVFNVGHRVQTFTNPLWVLLLSVPYAVLGEPYLVMMLLGLMTSWSAAVLLGWVLAPHPVAGALGLVLLTLSEAVGDFSTSGLENPLCHLLVLAVLVHLLRPEKGDGKAWVPWLWAGLALTTRMDTAVLLAPWLVALGMRALRAVPGWKAKHRRFGAVLRTVTPPIAIGLSPFLLWEGFALFYYGSLVPNTALAKLGASLPRHEVLGQGLVYVLTSLERDPLTPLLIGSAILLAVRQRATRPVAWGLLLHMAYVVWVGGDFMAGRFLSTPTVAAAGFIVWRLGASHTPPVALWVAAGLAASIALLSPYNPLSAPAKQRIPPTGIVSERDYYGAELGIIPNLRQQGFKEHRFWKDGSRFREEGKRVVVHANAGLPGYAAGPARHLVDRHALTDPLLARMPIMYKPTWRPGHFGRKWPDGYLKTLESGQNHLRDPSYRKLYERLKLVTEGPLLSWKRFTAIYELHRAH